MKKINYTRRKFVQLSTAAAGGAAMMPGMVLPRGLSKDQSDIRTLRLGFVGIGGRGTYHLNCALGMEGIEVPAICEIKPDRLKKAKERIEAAGLPAPKLYGKNVTDFKRMCDNEQLDAVICCTSWEWHTPVALASMNTGKHCVSEVPMVLTLDEAWQIVETYEKTGKWATIGLEGFGQLAVLNMIRKGMLGDIVHAETGYIHDLRLVKFSPDEEPWRLQHSINRNGNLYPDHPMNKMLPALDINHGDRIEYLVSMSSFGGMLNDYAAVYYKNKNHPLTKKEIKLGNYNASLIKTVNGKMLTLIHDTSTPHPREHYRIQGTKGVFLGDSYSKKIYIEGISPVEHQWENADKYLKENEHPVILSYKPAPRRGGKIEGHGGGGTETPLIWHRLATALRENKLPDWDVYDSVTSGAISPITEASVAERGKPVDFPDFTKGKWKTRPQINLD
ncbi:MAG TPA: Gfo/Idh/MocA family oxidoreductase [Bacteroidales bacterium]|jgi:predicted dehydrogenase|nr:Gfo/Idh/MocA family oxidoreductase [Bacteroidales bacterium]